VLYEAFKVDRCADLILAMQSSYDELMKQAMELVAK
jgi:hypothetical protein